MKASESSIEEIIDFKGLWDLPSKCGIRRIKKENVYVVIVTELYQDNPGSSITSVSASLATQIAKRYNINPQQLIYIECSPNMNSKLSFYNEEYYHVKFEIKEGEFTNPQWSKLLKEEFIKLIK